MATSRRNDLWKTLAEKATGLEISPNKAAKLMPLALVDANPWQPRQHFDQDRLAELVEDIKLRGILQPLVVRPIAGERYQVVAGERRYRAARLLNLEIIPVVVKEDLTEEEARAISLVENLQREDLDIEDEARFLKALIDQGMSLRDVGAIIHKSYQYVNRRIKLLQEPEALLAYREGRLNLNDILAGRTEHPADATAAELEDSNDDVVTAGNSNSLDGALVTRGNRSVADGLEEVRFTRSTSTYKPFQKLQVFVRKLQPTTIPSGERANLRKTVNDLIQELTVLQGRLDEEETNVTS